MTKRIKLAIVATHPIQYHVPWFQKLAVQENIDLKVYYSFLPNPQQQGVGFDTSFQWDIPLLEGYLWEQTSNIHQALKRDKPSVVLLTGWYPRFLLQALWACIRLRIPRMIRAEANALKKRPWPIRTYHRFLLSRYHAFLAIGKANRNFYLLNNVSPKQIFDCPYFVDNHRFEQQFQKIAGQRDKIRSEWNIPNDSICFLYVGKLIPKKRIFDLLQALRLASQRHAKLNLLIVGTGELMSKTQQMVKEYSLSVIFTGFLNQTEITRAYAAADCLILPSDYGETWGLVVNEAMVCGLPVIVSDHVGCGPDLVEEGITGSVFPFGNVEALSERLFGFANNPQYLKKMGEQVKLRIQSYSVEETLKGTLQAIHAVLSKKNSTSKLFSCASCI